MYQRTKVKILVLSSVMGRVAVWLTGRDENRLHLTQRVIVRGYGPPPSALRHACPAATQTLKYLSKTPCGRQRPEMVGAFLSAMMRHKLTKSVPPPPSIFPHAKMRRASVDATGVPFRLSPGLRSCSCSTTDRGPPWRCSW